MTPARFRWGIILIQLGVLILLANLDVINYNFFLEALVFLAVVLIMVGIEKIFTRSKLQIIAYLSSVGIFVAGFAIAFNSSMGGEMGSYISNTTYRTSLDPEVTKIKAVLNLDDVGLTIRDAGTDLLYGRFDEFTTKPEIEYRLVDGVAYLDVCKRYGSFLGGAIRIDDSKNRDWNLRFAESVPIDMECYADEADIHLNMSTSHLENLKLEADESDIYLVLGDLQPTVKVSIKGRDSKLKLRIPEDVGLRIFGEDYGTYLDRFGLIKAENGSFESLGYDTLTTRIEVDLDYQLKSFILDYL